MKRKMKTIYMLPVLLFGLLIVSCSDMEKDFEADLVEYPPITVDGFSPQSGRPGSPVSITGTNFGEYSDAATVMFNGVEVTNFVSYSDTVIVVSVPQDAGTGPITVNIWTHSVTTESDFDYLPGATISGISPAEAAVGDQITIQGENFGTDPEAVTVYFSGEVEATIESITETEIVVTVPEGGLRGPITVEIGSQTLSTPVFSYPFVGLDFDFNTDGDSEGWTTSHNSTFEVSGGTMNVFYDMTASKRRADFSLEGGAEVHAGLYPIVAIRMINKPSTGNFIFDTNLGRYKDGSNNWDGVLVGDVYYYDLRNTFGSGATISQTEPTQLTTFQWKVADITSDETGYQVDWVKSFESVEKLEEYVAPPEGKYIFEFNGTPRTVTTDIMDDWIGRQGATTVIEDGYSKVTFDPAQFEGDSKRRSDFTWAMGGTWGDNPDLDKAPWVVSPDYPIYAIKIHFVQADGSLGGPRPAEGKIFYDRLGEFNDDYASQNVLWLDAREAGYTERTEIDAWWSIKIPDIVSDEQGYWVDWHRTFSSVEELEAFIGQ